MKLSHSIKVIGFSLKTEDNEGLSYNRIYEFDCQGQVKFLAYATHLSCNPGLSERLFQ